METARLSRPIWRWRFSGLSRPRWRRPDFRDHGGYGATQETARLKKKRRDQEFIPRDQGGDSATFQTKAETARLSRPTRRWRFSGLSRPRWRRPDFRDHGGYGATQETARLKKKSDQEFIPRDQGGDGATFQTEVETAQQKKFFATVVEGGATLPIRLKTAQTTVHMARLSRTRRKPRDFPDRGRDDAFSDQGGEGATFRTIAETARPRINSSRPRRRRRDFPNQSGDGATFQTRTETAPFSRPKRRCRDQDYIPRDQGGDDATFQTKAETTRLSRPKRRRRDFSDQDGNGAIFQTEAETAQPRTNSSPPWWMWRKFSDQCVETAQPGSRRIRI